MERIKQNSKKPGTEAKASSQTARAVLSVREMLVQGRFRPGERIREVPLAAQLKVSRIPLHLALERLAHEGFLEIRATRGFVVQRFSTQDIYDAIDIRGMLEGMAARLAVERLPADPAKAKTSLAPLGKCVADLDRALASSPRSGAEAFADAAEPFAHYVELNERLHAALLELAQSDTLSREMQRVSCLPFAAPSSGFVRMQADIPESWRVLQIAQDQHHAILESIAAREAARAENLLREHARLVRRNLEIAIHDHRVHHLVPGLRLIKDVPAASRGHDAPGAS